MSIFSLNVCGADHFGSITSHVNNIITLCMGYFQGKPLFPLDVRSSDPCCCYQLENRVTYSEEDTHKEI